MSLVYVGISQNVAPLVTVVMSYFMTGERLKNIDIIMLLITFGGVSLISYGFKKSAQMPKTIPLSAYLGCFLIPFLMSYGNIIMRLMPGLHENAVSCYLSLFMIIFCLIYMLAMDISFDGYGELFVFDWVLIVFFGALTVFNQTLKFMALQNEEPAKLSHFQYLNSGYQLAYDVFLFGAVFQDLQWVGMAIMFCAYAVKAYLEIKKA